MRAGRAGLWSQAPVNKKKRKKKKRREKGRERERERERERNEEKEPENAGGAMRRASSENGTKRSREYSEWLVRFITFEKRRKEANSQWKANGDKNIEKGWTARWQSLGKRHYSVVCISKALGLPLSPCLSSSFLTASYSAVRVNTHGWLNREPFCHM